VLRRFREDAMLRSMNLTSGATRSLVSASTAPRQALIGPAVRLLLQDYQIDPQQLKASGPKGNLLKSDVLSHISHSNLRPNPPKVHAKPEPTTNIGRPIPPITEKPVFGSKKRHVRRKYEDIPVKSGDEKRNLAEAHYSLTSELIVDDLLSELEKFDVHADDADGKHSLFNDFVRRASAEACRRVPEAHLRIEPFVSVSQHIVESERNEGRLHSHEFQVSNLGKFDSVDHFTPIAQAHPQIYTLALGSTTKRLILAEDGIRQVTTIKVTLSCDNRAVDTTLGAQWFRHFKRFVEHPNIIFL